MDNPICVCVDRNPFDTSDELVALLRETGLDGVEWFESGAEDKWSNAPAAAHLRGLTRRHGLLAQYHAPYEAPFDLACENDAPRPAQGMRAMLVEFMDRAERLDARQITLHAGNLPPGADRADMLRRVADGISLALPELERRAMRFAIENHTSAILAAPLGDRPDEMDWLMAALPSPWIGLTLDIGHAHINNHLAEFLARPLGRVFNTHLHDNNGREDEHLPIGAGTIEWDGLLRRLAAECAQGTMTLEFFAEPHHYRAAISRIRAAKA